MIKKLSTELEDVKELLGPNPEQKPKADCNLM